MELVRVVVPSRDEGGLDDFVSDHFGRCRSFTIARIGGGKIKDVESVGNPFFEAHEPFKVPEYLSTLKPAFVICGGIGPRAISALNSYGIKTIYGCAGKIADVLRDFAEGKLHEGENSCHHV